MISSWRISRKTPETISMTLIKRSTTYKGIQASTTKISVNSRRWPRRREKKKSMKSRRRAKVILTYQR